MSGVDLPRWMWELSDDYPFGEPPPVCLPALAIGFHANYWEECDSKFRQTGAARVSFHHDRMRHMYFSSACF